MILPHTPGPWRLGRDRDAVVCDQQHPGNHEMELSPRPDGRRTDLEFYGGYLLAESIRREADARLMAASPSLLNVAKAYLLFHSAGPWDTQKKLEWDRLTGCRECTTKALGDLARTAIAEAEGA